jgi:serine/threonine-protein kinase RsbW/stage II sporulation protein AB (anti-sigma F factor)
VVEAVRLAASEALTNAVLHAYPDGGGRVHVTALATSSELWLLIGDDGCGLRAGYKSAGLGLGLGLISQVSEEFLIVERSSGGLELRIRFALDWASEFSQDASGAA